MSVFLERASPVRVGPDGLHHNGTPGTETGQFRLAPLARPFSLLLASTLHTSLHGALSYAFFDSHVDFGLAAAR